MDNPVIIATFLSEFQIIYFRSKFSVLIDSLLGLQQKLAKIHFGFGGGIFAGLGGAGGLAIGRTGGLTAFAPGDGMAGGTDGLVGTACWSCEECFV